MKHENVYDLIKNIVAKSTELKNKYMLVSFVRMKMTIITILKNLKMMEMG